MANKEDLFEALGIIHDAIQDEKVEWHLNGSFNLLVNNIETDENGIKIFKEKLREFLQDDKYNKKIKAHSLIFNINGLDVEVLAHDDPELAMLNSSKVVKLDDMNIPVLPLKEAMHFYKSVGKNDKVKLIQEHLDLLNQLNV
jgi:hypothetical protein